VKKSHLSDVLDCSLLFSLSAGIPSFVFCCRLHSDGGRPFCTDPSAGLSSDVVENASAGLSSDVVEPPTAHLSSGVLFLKKD
jgi:hypothetical protein